MPRGIEPVLDQLPQRMISDSGTFVAGFVAPDYLIDGIVRRGCFYTLTAKTGAGKTSACLLFAYHVATANPLCDRRVALGRVLYLAGENADDVRGRWLLAADCYGFDPDAIDVSFVPAIFDLAHSFPKLRAEADELGGFDLVILDTLAAYSMVDDENDNQQMGAYARIVRRLTELPGNPCVIAAAHPVKNATREHLLPRGGGAMIAEVDGNLTLWTSDRELVELHWQGKHRGPDFEPLTFRIESGTSERVKDAAGRLLPSVIALPVSEAEASEALDAARSDEDALLLAMLENEQASIAKLAEAAGWFTSTNQPYKAKAHRTIQALKDDNLVRFYRGRWVLAAAGKKAAKEVREGDEKGLYGGQK